VSTATGNDKILELAKKLGALKFGEFKLTSGQMSSYYFDGRLLTLDPEGAYESAKALVPLLTAAGAEAVAGPAVAAVPMVAAIAVVSHLEGRPIPALIVRTEAKQHGTKKMIEGTLRPGIKVAVVDDTCSTGGSLNHAIEAVEAAGCKVVKVACILDRNMGGGEGIRSRGYDFTSLLVANEKGEISAI